MQVRISPFWLMAGMSFAVAPAAFAQTAVTVMHDNDEWAHTDEEYSEGSRLTAIDPEWGQLDVAQTLARLLPGMTTGSGVSAGFGAGSYLYVPRTISATGPIADQRPYAGWLHVSGLLTGETDSHLDTWKLDAGVVGPAAQGEELVSFFHHIFRGRDMEGWDNQIRNRLGLEVSWQRRWRNLFDVGGGMKLDVSPAVGVEVGSVSDAAQAGLTARLGWGLDRDFGAPRAGGLSGSLSRRGGDGWSGYLFASASGGYSGYDVFIDEPGGRAGDPVRAGSAIRREAWRSETSIGFVLAHGNARASFAWTDQSKLYDQQAGHHQYGEVTLGFAF
jgi:hypothetical protein